MCKMGIKNIATSILQFPDKVMVLRFTADKEPTRCTVIIGMRMNWVTVNEVIPFNLQESSAMAWLTR